MPLRWSAASVALVVSVVPDYDPRVVDLYDAENPDGPDHAFYRALIDRVGARDVVDLGCGTGLLTVTLPGPDRTVTGIDPSRAMLDYARHRPGGDAVTWVLGDSRDIMSESADLVVMSGNVAQHISGEDWPRTLADTYRGLRPHGHLTFERRNPAARAFDNWTREKTLSTRDSPVGTIREWMEPAATGAEVRAFDCHTVFTDTGEHLVETLTLSFRDEISIRADLEGAGFTIVDVRGGWLGEAVSDDSGLLVFHARKG